MPDNTPPLHALIEQASSLVREIHKGRGRKGNIDALRDQAATLIRALDSEHPQLSLIQQTFGLVRDLANGEADSDHLRKRAEEIVARQQEPARPTGRRHPPHAASSRQADAWILDMFGATESAIPREALVDQFVERYRRERHVTDNDRHGGPWLFVFEAEGAEEEMPPGIRPLTGLGIHPEAFRGRCKEHLSRWESDPFLSYVLKEGYDIDGWYALPFGNSPLFDALLDIRRRMGGEPDYWLNAVYLPGDGRYNSRAIFVLYRNAGDSLYPEPPSGLRQDMRLLTVLGLAWRQLEHQMKALARISEADRRDLINLIAPGLLHHEIGFNMRTAYGQAYEQFHLLKRIADETGREDVDLAARYAHGIAGLVLKLYRITDAFNNLDKRGQIEDSTLQQVFEGVKTLLHHRLGAAHTEFLWNEPAFHAQPLHTDVVLLTQALLNIVNNAINAMVEDDTGPPRRIHAAIETTDKNRLTLTLVNNGPPIPAGETRNIFKRGYTTRQQGHGQGLYLARLVAHYLGGELQLMEGQAVSKGFHAGFRFTLSRYLSAEEGVARDAD